MQTYRRLNDPTRYYGLSWRGWIGVVAGGGVVYLGVRFSPLDARPTITLLVFLLAIVGVGLYALSGQALGIRAYATAFLRWRLGPKHYTAAPEDTPQGGILVDGGLPAALLDPTPDDELWTLDDDPADLDTELSA
jgi:hypothetical protein